MEAKCKLKTLKDLDESIRLSEAFSQHAHLKIEAIKWLNCADKNQHSLDENDFMDFFNITEEDLK